LELREYIDPLTKWWWLIAAATLVAAISSFLSVSQQPPIYQARTMLMVGRVIDNPNPNNSDFSVGQQLAATYVNIANTENMRQQTMAALGLNGMPAYVARPLPNTQLIEIAVTDTSPERAQAVANELANQLVLQSPTAPTQEEQERRAFIEEQLNSLQTNILETEEVITARQDDLKELVSAREIDEAQTQISALQAKLNTFQSSYAALLSHTEGGAANIVTVIDPASLPRRPIGPNVWATVLPAAAVGFALAAAAAYLLEYLDDRIKTANDVERICGLTTLASITRIKAGDSKHELITLEHPYSPVSEAFRVLRTSIQFSNVDKPHRTLLITSSNSAEGKSLVASNLAVVMAQAANKVLLIDADLRRPVQHKTFGLENNHGLTTLLLQIRPTPDGQATENDDLVEGLVQTTSEPGLFVLTSGPVPPNPSELLTSFKMKIALASLLRKFDYLILDSPPVLPVTDAIVLSSQVDSAMILVDSAQTRRKQLKVALGRLRDVDANLAGVILNRLSSAGKSYGFYYYGEQKPYYHDEPGDVRKRELSANGLNRARGLLSNWRRKEQT